VSGDGTPVFAVLARKPDPAPASDAGENPAPADTDAMVPVSASPGTGLVPLLAATSRASARTRLLRWARCRVADAADYQRRHRTFWHAVTVFVTRPPETWAETAAHLQSRKWLQPWMTGKFRVFCEWENLAWGHLVSMPAKAVFQNAEKILFERQLGFWLAVLFAGLCVLICLVTS
jgi:hypothetical protein